MGAQIASRVLDVDNYIQNITYDNNIFILNGARCVFYLSATGVVRDITMRNNICIGSNRYGWLGFFGTGTIQNITVQNNDVYNNINNNQVYYESGRTVTNLDMANNLYVNPVFISSTNFHLQSVSPLIDRGLDVGLTVDYDSVAIPIGSAPDIGAYEYGVPSPAIDPIVVSTVRPYWINSTIAMSGGYVTDDGGGTVSARGICWSTSPYPTTSDSKTSAGSGTGAFTAYMTGLNNQLTYYVRAYATNEAGTSYGNQLTFRSEQYVRYQVERGVFTDGYLLTPRGARGKLPAIVAFHQTCLTQAKQPAGVDATDSTMMYGVHLVRRGYVVWAPRCFIFQPNGGRSTGQKPTKTAAFTEATRKVLVTHPAWKGMTRMACDASRVVDYLETLPMVDGNRIGCIGHSLGAKEVLYAAAFDERIKAAVFSEGGIGLTSSNWAAIWYLGPDIRRPDFSLEHHQLLSLIAPRGFLLLAGGHADGDGSWPFIEAVLPVYKLLGGPENIKWFNHHQGHTYPAEARAVAEAFLDQYLKQ